VRVKLNNNDRGYNQIFEQTTEQNRKGAGMGSVEGPVEKANGSK